MTAVMGRSVGKEQARLATGMIAAVALGVALIIAGAIAGWGWTRLIGATLIVIGGGGLGIVIGLFEPRRQRLRAAWHARRRVIAVALGVILVLPVVLALGAGVIGLFLRNDSGSTALASGGTVLALALLAATVASAIIALRATYRALTTRTNAHDANAEHDPQGVRP